MMELVIRVRNESIENWVKEDLNLQIETLIVIENKI